MKKRRGVGKKALATAVALALALAVGGLVGSAQAAPYPVDLLTNQITKMKYVNYENWLDIGSVTGFSAPGDGIINPGDKFEGILKLEAITNVSGSISLSAQLG